MSENTPDPIDQKSNDPEITITETPEGEKSQIPEKVPTTEEVATTAKTPKRVTKTVIFSPEEFDNLDKIYQARVESKITEDYNHFIRQIIDFALNANNNFQRAKFAVPEGVTVAFKNAFVTPKN